MQISQVYAGSKPTLGPDVVLSRPELIGKTSSAAASLGKLVSEPIRSASNDPSAFLPSMLLNFDSLESLQHLKTHAGNDSNIKFISNRTIMAFHVSASPMSFLKMILDANKAALVGR